MFSLTRFKQSFNTEENTMLRSALETEYSKPTFVQGRNSGAVVDADRQWALVVGRLINEKYGDKMEVLRNRIKNRVKYFRAISAGVSDISKRADFHQELFGKK